MECLGNDVQFLTVVALCLQNGQQFLYRCVTDSLTLEFGNDTVKANLLNLVNGNCYVNNFVGLANYLGDA